MAIPALCLMIGCGKGLEVSQTATDVDPDAPDRIGSPIESRDIRSVARQMAERLLLCPQIERATKRPRIAVLRVRNWTRHKDLDTRIYTDIMQAELLTHARDQIIFVDRSRLRDTERERALKEGGEVDAAAIKPKMGVDFFLTGDLRDHSLGSPKGITDYVVHSFKLINPDTNEAVWTDNFQTKRRSKRGSAYGGKGN